MAEIAYWGVFTLQGFATVAIANIICRYVDLVLAGRRSILEAVPAGILCSALGFCTYKFAMAILMTATSHKGGL